MILAFGNDLEFFLKGQAFYFGSVLKFILNI